MRSAVCVSASRSVRRSLIRINLRKLLFRRTYGLRKLIVFNVHLAPNLRASVNSRGGNAQINRPRESWPTTGAAVFVRHMVILILFCAGLTAGHAQSASGSDRRHRNILEKRSTVFENLQFELHQLRDKCHENGLIQAETELTQLLQELTPDALESRAPQAVSAPVSLAVPETERQWRQQTLNLRKGRAKELYTLARKSLRAGLPSIAYMLIHDVLRLDPDHVNARAIFGQQKFIDPFYTDDDFYAGEWVSVWEAKMRGGRTPHIPDDRFGWIPREHLRRYEEDPQ